jgi:putative membrane protein
MSEPTDEARIFAIERPHSSLLTYYLFASLLLGPLFLLLLIPRLIRYITLRYRFDSEGISMAWGVLFRREVYVAYRRIQDIHLRSNAVERWLGLARVHVQTASGSAEAEMTIEGLREFPMIRDFLYARMRGLEEPASGGDDGGAQDAPPSRADDALTEALREVAAELRKTREALGRHASGRSDV